MTTPTPEPLATAVDSAALDDLRRRAGEPDDLRRALAERISIPADAPMAAILTTLDRILAERSHEPPEGTELVDGPTLEQLREDAERGRNIRRDQLLAEAITVGKIPPSARPSWEVLFSTDQASAEAALAKIRPNTIPTAAVGYSTGDDRDPLYDSVYGTP